MWLQKSQQKTKIHFVKSLMSCFGVFLQLCVLSVPWIPWPPVHHGMRLPRRRVQMLPWVWLPRPDSPDPVHQEDPALKRKKNCFAAPFPPPPFSLSLTHFHPFFSSSCPTTSNSASSAVPDGQNRRWDWTSGAYRRQWFPAHLLFLLF